MGQRLVWLILIVSCFGALQACSQGGSQGAVASMNVSDWKSVPMSLNFWTPAYDGYGEIRFDSNGLYLAPKASTVPSETHAALVLSHETLSGSYRVRVVYKNVRALRSPASNPWEVFWLFFDYQSVSGDPSAKKTNYFIIKPNGAELGTAFSNVGQNFLATSTSSNVSIGDRVELVLERRAGEVTVQVNGTTVISYTDNGGASSLFDQNGKIGLYTEDAAVQIESVDISGL